MTARLKNDRIDLRDHLPRLHRRIKIGKELLDIARDLAANLHVHDRIQCAGCGDGLRDRAARHRHGLKFCPLPTTALGKKQRGHDNCDDTDDERIGRFNMVPAR